MSSATKPVPALPETRNPSPEERERRLVLRAQLGDRAAFEDLLHSTQGWLARYLGRLIADRETRLDVLQEVFVVIYRRLTSLRRAELYRPWVYRIASRRAARGLRWRRRALARERPLPVDEPAAPELERPDRELRDRLRRSVAHLPVGTRSVVRLHYFGELSLRETADVLDLPIGTTKSRLAHGLKLLRIELDKETEHETT